MAIDLGGGASRTEARAEVVASERTLLPPVLRACGEEESASTLSARSWADSQAPMGYGTTRTLERVMATCGLLTSAGLEFVAADDVSQGGVLCALPALWTEGLLRHTRSVYTLPPGYDPLESIFLGLALLALVRCPSLEQTRYQAPGEWGKLLGLDRLPEVKTLREKIGLLCAQEGRAARWQSRLAQEWMAGVGEEDSGSVGLFYVDGHVRVYHGELGPLPRLYVARQKLRLRGTTDYWVNGLGGEPFFVGTQPLPETTEVVNPARRALEAQIRRERAKLQRWQAQFGAHGLPAQPTPAQRERFELQGGQLRESIQAQTAVVDALKGKRANTPGKVQLKELPEAERFRQLQPESKHFIDTIKPIAYRAESALAGEVREHLGREEDARALLRRVFVTPANLRPNYQEGTLTVEVHRLGSPLQDAALTKLCEELTATQTVFPTTSLRLIYRQVGSP